MNLKSVIEIKEVFKSACKKSKGDGFEKSTAILFFAYFPFFLFGMH